jgi:electron transport complex protein RnfB
MLSAVAIMAGLALLTGLALAGAVLRLRQTGESPVDQVNALLPQTQCAQCGYPGCRPYAAAILAGDANIDQCAPGGDATVTALANLLGRDTRPVDPAFGTTGPATIALIDEDACIGCALCTPACPVDAIVGAALYTHTVISQECTGCELCLPPCPVDCITIVPRNIRRAA